MCTPGCGNVAYSMDSRFSFGNTVKSISKFLCCIYEYMVAYSVLWDLMEVPQHRRACLLKRPGREIFSTYKNSSHYCQKDSRNITDMNRSDKQGSEAYSCQLSTLQDLHGLHPSLYRSLTSLRSISASSG